MICVRNSSNGLALAFAAWALASPGLAQEPGSQKTREFVQAAAQSDAFEIIESTTIIAQSQDADVRAFAQSMIDAHRGTTADLLRAVAKAGLKPPLPGLGNDQSQFLAALQSQRGVDLDKAYIKQQILAHRAALAVDQAYASSGDDASIRAVASSAVPVVTSHLQMIEQMQAPAPN